MTARLRTPLTELVGIEHPVVQTGMGWVAGARLVSATSNAGTEPRVTDDICTTSE